MGRKALTQAAKDRRAKLGERIDFARRNLGWTQTKLAEELGVSRPALSSWISGVHGPTPENLAELCRVTGEPMSFFHVSDEVELSDSAAFGRELARRIGNDAAMEILALPDEALASRLTAGDRESFGLVMAEAFTQEQLESLTEMVMVASRLQVVGSVLDSVKSMTDGMLRARGSIDAETARDIKARAKRAARNR